MNEYLFGAGAVLALSFVGWIVATEVRLRTLQGKLLVQDEKVKDDETVSSVHDDSDAELNDLVREDIGGT